MNKITEKIRKTGVFYLATVDSENQPRVRPFGAVAEFEGKVYICTNNTKKCYDEMMKNPKVEICGMLDEGTWIRVCGKAVRDDRDEARQAMLDSNEGFKNMYSIGDGILEVLYIDEAVCTEYSFTSAPVVIE